MSYHGPGRSEKLWFNSFIFFKNKWSNHSISRYDVEQKYRKRQFWKRAFFNIFYNTIGDNKVYFSGIIKQKYLFFFKYRFRKIICEMRKFLLLVTHRIVFSSGVEKFHIRYFDFCSIDFNYGEKLVINYY